LSYGRIDEEKSYHGGAPGETLRAG